MVVSHISGIDVLLGPFDFQVAQGIRAQEIYNILMGLQRMYDYIVIDSGSNLSENVVTQMDIADRILLVATPDLPSLQDTKRFIDLSHSLDYSSEKMLVVLNRAGLTGSVKSSDIQTSLNRDIFMEIPEDGAKVLRSLNRGIPMVMRYPRSSTSKGIQKLAQKLEQQRVRVEHGQESDGLPDPI